MISNAAHFSMKLDQSMKALFLSSITETKNSIIIGKRNFVIFATIRVSHCDFSIKIVWFLHFQLGIG